MQFPQDIEEAIDGFAKQEGISREEALALIARDWLIGQGLLKPDKDDGKDA